MKPIVSNQNGPVQCSLEKLAALHPGECNFQSYENLKAYANRALPVRYATFDEFLDDYGRGPLWLNLCIRWDVEPRHDSGGYRAWIYFLAQRLGVFYPVLIDDLQEKDVPGFCAYLKKHWRLLQAQWSPISEAPAGGRHMSAADAWKGACPDK